ncbi:MAG: type II secretion system F family protein [Deltaproteobacteria bacterium]|uniref:type II secretion system F family protein n=1 Tax=Candidatus Deferrimicrobium sp. TaxID=3060586 RepID=UPI002720481F|nr:type II secretion system F family protein [Candidatus Deferrimicrobium sp.]MCR4309305.1 type II secretion system F family protein [Deltaproteobacteria bacterium]MDO8739694.1 type II secretion system F family protein [Candidatus Deferrimicrobium sp.]
MARYDYNAVDDYGRKARGTMSSPDEKSLRDQLATMGMHLVSNRQVAESSGRALFKKKIKRADLIDFTYHLKTLLGAGVSLVIGLSDVAEQSTSPEFREVLRDIRRNVQSGTTLSGAFALHPDVFPEVFVSIMRAGEVTGNMDGALSDLNRFLTWQEELGKTIRQATYYPMTVVGMVSGLIILLFTFVFPRFLAIFKGAVIDLPLPTRVVIAISEFFRDYGLYALAAIVAGVVALRMYGRTEAGRLRVDGWKLKIPLVGEVIRAIEMSQFSHFTASLFRAGVEMTQTLAVVEKVMGNRVLAAVVRQAREEMIAGGGLSVALRKSGEFPPMVLRMVSAGESSGNLDATLDNVSAYYDKEVPAIVKKTFAILEPAMTILLALVVLGAALSFFLALYKMVGSMGATK